MIPVLLFSLLLAASVTIRGVGGEMLRPLEPAGPAGVLVFVTTDCPVSNGYAPEIQRICSAYQARGVSCTLIYEDVGVSTAAVRAHLGDFRYGKMPAAIDGDGAIAARVGATVTPEAVVVTRDGRVAYDGRIDNRYEAIGRQRRTVTAHDLVDAIDAVLTGTPVTTAAAPAVGCFIVPSDMRRKHP